MEDIVIEQLSVNGKKFYPKVSTKAIIDAPEGGFVKNIVLSLDNDYILSVQLKNDKDQLIGTKQSVDLPLGSMVVNGTYNNETKKIELILQNGNKVEFSVADLVDGLQPTLVSGTNIKTINGETVLGSGNITIQGGGDDIVEYTDNEFNFLSDLMIYDDFGAYVHRNKGLYLPYEHYFVLKDYYPEEFTGFNLFLYEDSVFDAEFIGKIINGNDGTYYYELENIDLDSLMI